MISQFLITVRKIELRTALETLFALPECHDTLERLFALFECNDTLKRAIRIQTKLLTFKTTKLITQTMDAKAEHPEQEGGQQQEVDDYELDDLPVWCV